MIYEEKTNVIGNRVEVSIRYIREHWHEWLWIFISEGEACPHFYLPVYRTEYRHGYIAWVIPLAPFIVVIVALNAAFHVFWRDCIWVVGRWKKERNRM